MSSLLRGINMAVMSWRRDGSSKCPSNSAMKGPQSEREKASGPCKHARPNLHPVSWEAMAGSRPDDSCTLACFRTRSVWPKYDTISQSQIGSRLVLHNIIQDVCRRMRLSLKVGNWYQASCVLPGTGPDDSCTPAHFQTRCV